MNPRLSRMTFVWAVPVLLGVIAAFGGRYYLAESIAAQAARQSDIAPAHFAALNVSLPAGAAAFPAGKGSDIANANCLICHSARYVTMQPPFSRAVWEKEVKKMIDAYGATISEADQREIVDYLVVVRGSSPGK